MTKHRPFPLSLNDATWERLDALAPLYVFVGYEMKLNDYLPHVLLVGLRAEETRLSFKVAPPLVEPLDVADRAALATWIGALWYKVQDALAYGIDATHADPKYRQNPIPVLRERIADRAGEIEALFSRIRPLLKEGGVPVYEPPPDPTSGRRRARKGRSA